MKDKYAIYINKEKGKNTYIVADRELHEIVGLPIQNCVICVATNELGAHLISYCLNKFDKDILNNMFSDVLFQLIKSLEVQAKEEQFVEGKTQEWSGLNFEEILESLKKGN